jgi:hypothetical protein
MKQWTKDIVINTPIEAVWKYLNGSSENMQKIMPQVVEHTPIKITDEGIGSVYLQKYKEGKRIEEYEVETLEYSNEPNHKKLKVGFTLAKMFEITAFYELERIDDHKTKLTYTVTNRALRWLAKLFLLMANEKVVVGFLKKVKKVAESEYQQAS